MSLSYDIPKDEIRSGRFVLDGEVWIKERKCHMIYRCSFKPNHDLHVIECSECGSLFFQTKGNLPRAHYCAGCGAKVVSE